MEEGAGGYLFILSVVAWFCFLYPCIHAFSVYMQRTLGAEFIKV